MNILYVEDNAANARLVARYLALTPGVSLFEAASAEQGLALAQAQPLDLILMDINLPGMSGLDALVSLRRDPALSAIAVVAVSADALPDKVQAAMALGFDDYLTKPLDFAHFDAVIARYRPL